MSLPIFIRTGRLRLRMTQEEFAKAVGVTRAAVQQWERVGGTAPRRVFQPRVAELLGVSVTELFDASFRASKSQSASTPQRVPILPEHEVVDFHLLDNFRDFDGHETVQSPVVVQRQTFAMRPTGDAAAALAGNMEIDQLVVVVEPALKPRPQDLVVVINDGNPPTVKQLIHDDGQVLLRPFDVRLPIKPVDGSVLIGVVRACVKHFR
jgi:SOS-response transcriptional repressor LexA